jgi:hypothetical protein
MHSVSQLCRSDRCSDRRVVMLVEMARKKEKAESDRARAAATPGPTTTKAPTGLPPADEVGLAATTFEDPGMKAITAKEAKEKERKKAQKKKARAKKRAEAKANGGAGKKDDDSSDSGEDSAEAGMDDEERMMHRAPAFDLEQAKRDRAAASVAGPPKGNKK